MILNYLLIIFYIIKVVLDCKIIYIAFITENTIGLPHPKIMRNMLLFFHSTLIHPVIKFPISTVATIL